MVRKIRSGCLVGFIVLFALPGCLVAQRTTPSKAKPSSNVVRSIATVTQGGSLSVELSSVPGGAPIAAIGPSRRLDLGSVSYAGLAHDDVEVRKNSDSFVVTTAFGLAVKDASHSTRFASVSAYIPSGSGRIEFRIDNRKLSTTPLVVATHAVVGTVTRHELSIKVPTSANERELDDQFVVQFIVVPE